MKYKLGLLGENIGYSFSPAVHAEIFDYIGINAEYSLYDTPHGELEKRVAELKENLIGFNVTKPYKTDIIPLLDKDNSGCGAVNTVKISAQAEGYNTDGFGFIKSFAQDCPVPEGARTLVLGAGGAARIVVRMLKEHGFDVLVHNRTKARLDEITSTFGVSEYDGEGADIVVNCTSFGLKRGEDSLVGISVGKIKYAYDLIYNPAETDFLKDARERHGAVAKNGLDMLIYQAIRTDEIILPDTKFSGPDYAALRERILRRLKSDSVI